jgi:hypothetical protein
MAQREREIVDFRESGTASGYSATAHSQSRFGKGYLAADERRFYADKKMLWRVVAWPFREAC